MTNLQLADLQQNIDASLDGLQAALLARGDAVLQGKADTLQVQRKQLSQRALLSLAFSGQFNAGKSTTISALTGNREIRISADVATDDVQAYRWQEIELWDTPGLYADRTDHTDKAQQAMREADLIVYCLTTNLFDSVTADDFKRLAFANRFASKIFLLINKLSMDDVDDTEDFIANLAISINNTLAPHRLTEFKHAFVDAEDYRQGLASGDQALIAFSRFEEFIASLNHWVKEQGLLARLDPPIRLGLGVIDDVLGSLQDSTFEQSPELFLINQRLRIFQSHQQRTAGEIRRIGTALQQKVELLGEQLLNGELGSESEVAEADFRSSLEEINRQAYDDLNATLQAAYDRLQTKLEDFANQPFVAEYFSSVDASSTGQAPRDSGAKQAGPNQLFALTKNIVNEGRRNLFGKGVTPKAFLPGAKEVAGGGIHQGIYQVGKFFGHKFKPWEAVRMAKGVGQAVAVLGVVFAAYEVYEQVNDGMQAEERQRKAEQERSEFRRNIRKLAEAMIAQMHQDVQQGYEALVIAPMLDSLNSARDQLLVTEVSNRELVHSLSSRRDELKGYLEQLYAS